MKLTSIMNQNIRTGTLLLFGFMLLSVAEANIQNHCHRPSSGFSKLEVGHGIMELDTLDFNLKLGKISRTETALEFKSSKGFTFYSFRTTRRIDIPGF